MTAVALTKRTAQIMEKMPELISTITSLTTLPNAPTRFAVHAAVHPKTRGPKNDQSWSTAHQGKANLFNQSFVPTALHTSKWNIWSAEVTFERMWQLKWHQLLQAKLPHAASIAKRQRHRSPQFIACCAEHEEHVLQEPGLRHLLVHG